MKGSWRIVMFTVSGLLMLGLLQGGRASQAAQAESQPAAPAYSFAAPLPQQPT
jgi:hypothetical protein